MRQRAFVGIDGEYCDAVMPAVGGVDKFSGGMHVDFGIVIFAFEVFRQRRNCLQAVESAVFRSTDNAVTADAISATA